MRSYFVLSNVLLLGCLVLLVVSLAGVVAMGYGALHGVALHGTMGDLFALCLVAGVVSSVAGLMIHYWR